MRELFERLAQRLHGCHETDPQAGKVRLIFDFEHETDDKDGFACSRRAVYYGYAFLLGAAVFNIFLFLL